MLEPSANSINFTLGSSGTINVAGNLTVGNGANTGVNIDASTTDEAITVSGNITINPNSTLIADPMGSPITLDGNWINNGGTFTSGGSGGYVVFSGANQLIEGTAASQTFGNVTINETAGSTLTTGGSTTTLNVYAITQSSGIFTSPNILNITQNMSLVGTCTFNAGPLATLATNIYIEAEAGLKPPALPYLMQTKALLLLTAAVW